MFGRLATRRHRNYPSLPGTAASTNRVSAYDHYLCNRRQHTSRPVFRKAREVDLPASEEARGPPRAATRSARLSDAVLRSAANAALCRVVQISSTRLFKNRTAAIAQSDGFVIVTPEYNYGTSAVLKNALDWVYPQWHRKPVGFVSYGSAMGARAVQQLRKPRSSCSSPPFAHRSTSRSPRCRPTTRGRCGGRTGGARGARPDVHRRPAVVDRSLEEGARPRELNGPCTSNLMRSADPAIS